MKGDPIHNTEFVIFDVETTGLSPRWGDRLIEIAGLRLKKMKPVGRFESLVNPRRLISPGAMAVNGISQDMVDGAPAADEVLPRFLAFARGACLVAHNARFDVGFLNSELSLTGGRLDLEAPVIDTLKMARLLLPGLGRYSLAVVARFFGAVQQQTHRAMSDVMLTYEIFAPLLSLAGERKINDIQDLAAHFGYTSHTAQKEKLTMDILNRAIREDRPVNMTYFSPYYGSRTVRRVSPIRIVRERRRTVLVGFCHLRREEREFRVDRIVHLEE